MALDNGYQVAGRALPTPTDTPYETPSRGLSARSSHHGSSSPFDYSPSPFPPEEDYFLDQQASVSGGDDDRYNTRDPRRLTPNLGISFVSQIHTLKNEIETRDTVVGSLEETLHHTKSENERLTGELKASRAEVRTVKSQMKSFEDEMLREFTKIAKERDCAMESTGDARKHVEILKKKTRASEEEANMARLQRDEERQEWDNDKRKLESKIHLLEERLKTMVAEMMAVHNTAQDRPGPDESMQDISFVQREEPRSTSRFSNRSMEDAHEVREGINYRASRMSGLHKMGGSQMSGLSLAEELEMTEDEENIIENDKFDIHSPDSLPEERDMLPRRYSEDQKARKVMGFPTDSHESTFEEDKSGERSVDILEDYVNLPENPTMAYTDRGTQFTPPSTPALQPTQRDSVSGKLAEQIEHSANQSRKRVAIPSVFVEQTTVSKPEISKDSSMVSSGSQTEEVTGHFLPLSQAARHNPQESKSTQTIENIVLSPNPASNGLSSAPLDVPVIAIHPPTSRPPSSHTSVVLPPRTRNAGCQADINLPRDLTSTSMQTEEIRVDKRSVRIPPRLQASSLAIKPSSRITEKRVRTAKPPLSELSGAAAAAQGVRPVDTDIAKVHIKVPPSRKLTEEQSRPTLPRSGHTYPGNQAYESVKGKHSSKAHQPAASKDVFSKLDTTRQDSLGAVDDYSDDEAFAIAEPIRKTLTKVQNSWKLVPQSPSPTAEKFDLESEEVEDRKVTNIPRTIDSRPKRPSKTTSKTFQSKSIDSNSKAFSAARPADIRRKALVSNGIAEHAQRARSPSVPTSFGKEPPVVAPPFPVPTRSSSRKIPLSASDGAVSPTPYSTSFFTARRAQDQARPPSKRKILRKVQSAAAVPRAPERPPPPPPSISASSTVPGTPRSPLPPRNQFILPSESFTKLPSHTAPAPHSRVHAGQASIESTRQQTSVVDAIAQTMVGEWMWKYVRKRTSFGITENPQAEFEMGRNGETGNSSGVRHKRWVWLAPYENAVIWSSKQPTSGPALLGKGGRKLMIQSVLDVKDDTPLPKNAGSQTAFDRSILILTPQRALKFTAVSRDRHYIWLTALSFLSHSTRGMDDIAGPPPALPPPPEQEVHPPPSQEADNGFHRPMRDSIRVAKDRYRPNLGLHSFSSPTGEVQKVKIQDTLRMAWEDQEAESEDAAEPPQVPRVAAHARKRSSTGPRQVPLSAFHNYPTNATEMVSSFSLQGPTSRDKYDRYLPRPRGASASGPSSIKPAVAHRTTDPSRDSYVAPPPVVPDNFFDPAGTMRMEAFVRDDGQREVFELPKAEPAKAKKESRSYRTRQGRKKDLSYWGVGECVDNGKAGGGRMGEEDPFTGF